MFLIGLTGGIASGKSTVAKILAGYGADCIDADEIARQVVEPGTSGLELVVKEFGSTVLTPEGTLDRKQLGLMVFGDPEKRLKLESILHPLIKEQFLARIRSSTKDVVVYSVPLLVEAAVDYDFDLVVTVEAGVENQINRLIANRQLTRDQAIDRINSQTTPAARIARSDYQIDSSGTLDELQKEVSLLWANIQSSVKQKAADGKN